MSHLTTGGAQPISKSPHLSSPKSAAPAKPGFFTRLWQTRKKDVIIIIIALSVLALVAVLYLVYGKKLGLGGGLGGANTAVSGADSPLPKQFPLPEVDGDSSDGVSGLASSGSRVLYLQSCGYFLSPTGSGSIGGEGDGGAGSAVNPSSLAGSLPLQFYGYSYSPVSGAAQPLALAYNIDQSLATVDLNYYLALVQPTGTAGSGTLMMIPRNSLQFDTLGNLLPVQPSFAPAVVSPIYFQVATSDHLVLGQLFFGSPALSSTNYIALSSTSPFSTLSPVGLTATPTVVTASGLGQGQGQTPPLNLTTTFQLKYPDTPISFWYRDIYANVAAGAGAGAAAGTTTSSTLPHGSYMLVNNVMESSSRSAVLTLSPTGLQFQVESGTTPAQYLLCVPDVQYMLLLNGMLLLLDASGAVLWNSGSFTSLSSYFQLTPSGDFQILTQTGVLLWSLQNQSTGLNYPVRGSVNATCPNTN